MKDASTISAFAAYQKIKQKQNKAVEKKKPIKTKNDKIKLQTKVTTSTVVSSKPSKNLAVTDEETVFKQVNGSESNSEINLAKAKKQKRIKPKLVIEEPAETIKIKKSLKKNKHKTKLQGITKENLKKTTNLVKIKNKRVQRDQPAVETNTHYYNVEIGHTLTSSSAENAEQLFQWLIAPITITDFYRNYWEKEPLHIKRPNVRDYFKHLFSSEALDEMLRTNSLFYTRNIDVVTYCDGKRETHNPAEIRATPSAVWDYYSNECSVRILNPQTYNDKIHLLLATLQEYFGNTMGANIYLTPPGSQGFAPHWDDIEAFVLQLEGRKHWKLYGPKNKNQILARNSSHNLTRDELGPLIYSATVEAGDLLYFPRGTIHEACTDSDAHSLHITVSVYQNTSYADLLEKLLPDALKKASEEDVEFRRGLPLQYLNNVGAAVKHDKENRTQVISTVKTLLLKMLDHLDVDTAADQLGRKFMYDSLPPVLTNEEKLCSVRNDGEFLVDGKVHNRVEFQPDTEVRLLRQFCLRVVIEGSEAKIYYNTENSRQYHGEDEQFLEIDVTLVPAVSHLICSFPNFVAIEDLPISDDDLKLQIVSDLWERGLIVTKDRLDCIDDE